MMSPEENQPPGCLLITEYITCTPVPRTASELSNFTNSVEPGKHKFFLLKFK